MNELRLLPAASIVLCRLFLTGLFLFMPFMVLQAQETAIVGKITDSVTGDSVIGATVQVEGTNRVAVTNASGLYSITAPSDGTLVIQYFGYETANVSVDSRKTINVALNVSAIQIDEVVAIGYGHARQSDLTSSMSMVGEEDINKTPVNSIDQALQGNAPGVLVLNTSAEPGGGVSIRIRGGSSISGDNEPLIVIDDIPSDNTMLSALNPSDVKSMEVLKDAAATAIFGSRGANGVILVTTKSGQQGRAKFTVTAKHGLKFLSRELPMMDGPQYARYDNYARMNWGVNSVKNMRPDTLGTANHQKGLIHELAHRMEYGLQLSGGGRESKYFVSASYMDDKGLLGNSEEQRLTLRGKFDMKLAPKLDLNMNTNLSRNAVRKVAGGSSGPILRTFMQNPTSDMTGRNYADGVYYDEETGEVLSIQNETAKAMKGTDLTKTFNVEVNGRITWKIADYLRLEVTGSYKYKNGNVYKYVPRDIYQKESDVDKNNTAERSTATEISWTNANTLTFERTFKKKHYLQAMLGHQWEQTSGDGFGNKVRRFDTDYYMWDNLAAAAYYETPSSSVKHNAMLSFFARAIYTYDKRYSATVTLREDGSSRFGQSRQFGFFPSVSAGWTASNEKFMKDQHAVSFLKFRASWGVTGNNRIGDLQSIPLLNTGKVLIGGASYTGARINTLGNEFLQWETTRSANVAVDIAFLKNRISLTVEAYLKNTSMMLYDKRLSATTGYSKVKANIGGMDNRGLDFDLSTINIKTKDFQWSTDVNVGLIRGRVTDLGGDDELVMYRLGDNVNQDITFLKVGQPLPVFKGYKTSIYQNWDEVYADESLWVESQLAMHTRPGMLRYHDTNNDGRIDDDDKVILGHALPNGMGGITNTFTYRRLTLSIFFNGAWGHSVVNANAAKLMRFKAGADNQLRTMLDAFRPVNPITGDQGHSGGLIPLPTTNNATTVERDYMANLTQHWVEDASYLRLKSVMVSYNMPEKWVKKIGMQSMVLSVAGTNLYTWTKYTGFDPEMSSSYGSSNDRLGIDNSSYPPSAMVNFSINITF